MSTPASEAAKASTPATKVQKTFTNWEAFAKAGLAPVSLRCEGYKPIHGYDGSCHTALKLDADTVKRHFEGDHGGGFWVEVKPDSKPHPLWAELAKSGLEASDFRCDNCNQQIRWSPNSIIAHLKPHSGKTRRVYPGGKFNFTVTLSRPNIEEADEERELAD